MLSRVWLFTTPWTAAHQASLSITSSQSLLKLMSIESVMPSNRLILCCPLLLLPSILPSIRVFSSESVLPIRWPKYWSFSFSIHPSNEYSGLVFFCRGDKGKQTRLELTAVSAFGSKSTRLFASPWLCLLSLVFFPLHLCSTSASFVSAVSDSFSFPLPPTSLELFFLTDWSFNSSGITHVAISAINLEEGKKSFSSLCATAIQIWWTNLFYKTSLKPIFKKGGAVDSFGESSDSLGRTWVRCIQLGLQNWTFDLVPWFSEDLV